MSFHPITGTSQSSQSEAIGDALRGLEFLCRGARHVHVIITGIVKVGETWKALVTVVVQPKIDIASGQTSKKERALDQGGQPPEAALAADEQVAKIEEWLSHFREKLDIESLAIHTRDLEQMDEERALLHAYMLDAYQVDFEPFAARFDSVHYLGSSSALRAALDQPIEIGFYKATHPEAKTKSKKQKKPKTGLRPKGAEPKVA